MKLSIFSLVLALASLSAFANSTCSIVTTDATAASFMLRNNMPLVRESAPHQMTIDFEEDFTNHIVGQTLGTFTNGGEWIYLAKHVVVMNVRVLHNGEWQILQSNQLSHQARNRWVFSPSQPDVIASLKERLLRQSRRAIERYDCN